MTTNSKCSTPRRRTRKTLGYVIVMDSRAVRHQDSSPYWLQFSAYCELYPTYAAARRDFNKEIRLLARQRRKVSARLLNRWADSLCIIPVKK